MTQRNLILLIIILAAITSVGLGFLYFYRGPAVSPTGETTGLNFISQFLPFGKTTQPTAPVAPPADVSGFVPEPVAEAPKVKLHKVSSFPIAGLGIFQKERFKEVPMVVPSATTEPTENTKPAPPPTEFAPALRYVERSTGNIYQTFADKIEERKFTATIIPKVYEAYFGNKGEAVIMRYLKDDLRQGGASNQTIETFLGSLPKEVLGADTTGNNEVKGFFLPENVSDLSVAPDTLKIFYLFGVGDRAVGITADSLGGKKSQIFDSPFTEWLSQWPNARMITLTTKPSANVPGYMYAIDPNKKDINKILGDINGLTTLASSDAKSVLYSNNNLALNVYSIDTRNSDLLGVKTLPEKCVWSRGGDIAYCAVPKFIDSAEYPDAWYQGEISFFDQIWKIDVKNGTTTIISDPASAEGGEEIDGIKLALDDNENYLFFINKKNSSLWELELK